jgi:Large polyvalent protein-associated domain 7
MAEDVTSNNTQTASSQERAPGPARQELNSDGQLSEFDNSIRPSRRRTRAAGKSAQSPESDPPQSTRATAPATSTTGRVVPDHIRKRFVQVGHRYYFSDGAHAFTDRGARLVTPSENMEVVKSLIAIAEARGWKDITVSGSERFRKEAWGAASAVGLRVRGYTPTEFERALFARKLARGSAATPGTVEESARAGIARGADRHQGVRERPNGSITGRLIDHGAAAYRHDPQEPTSYFVKIDTPEGEREIWGIDLKRALKESLTQPKIGDEIGLKAIRRDAVTVQETERDSEGKAVGQKPLEAHRNRWIVERTDFLAERAAAARVLRDPSVNPKQAARRHPELVGTYLQMHAAQIAARRFKDPKDRERFVSHVRTALADAVARGEPLAPVRLKEKAAARAPEALRAQDSPAR